MRLEVHEHNKRAIARYEKSGYRLFGRHRDYYDDRGDALRFEKPLGRPSRSRLTPMRKSALMVDIANGAVANRFVSGYDDSCRA